MHTPGMQMNEEWGWYPEGWRFAHLGGTTTVVAVILIPLLQPVITHFAVLLKGMHCEDVITAALSQMGQAVTQAAVSPSDSAAHAQSISSTGHVYL